MSGRLSDKLPDLTADTHAFLAVDSTRPSRLTCPRSSRRSRSVSRLLIMHEEEAVPGTLVLIQNRTMRSEQMQDFMKLYSGLVERCFGSCVNDFSSKVLTGKEVSSPYGFIHDWSEKDEIAADLVEFRSFLQNTCVAHCADKFLKHSERVGARFAEHNGPYHTFAPHLCYVFNLEGRGWLSPRRS